ncbi:MAG: HAMP domain-containing protein [Rhodospirillaceae bacterium]|nr:HAMP domain-containing protein [Rhodospirillaceae bacterium]MBT6362867.1 HAMP domain-containing protein [Rhodospirillaceae bacterium]
MALMLILVGVVINSIGSILETEKAVDHTHEVLSEASAITRSAVDMETGMRGYLLAGQEGFLAPYLEGEKKTYVGIAALKKVVNDNPIQVKRLDQVRTILKEWQKNVTETTIGLRRDIGDGKTMNDMAKLVGEANGKIFFDKFRSQIAAFIDQELKLLEIRRNHSINTRERANENFEKVNQASARVHHTLEVLLAAHGLLNFAVDMETGMRGYLLAGKENFLEPYNSGVTKFYRGIDNLTNRVKDTPAQVRRLKNSAETIKDWQKEVSEPSIKLRRAIGNAKTMDDMADLIGKARGKRYFDQFRKVMADFEQEERNLMEVRQIANLKTTETTYWVIGAFTVIALIIGGLSTWLIGNSISSPLVNTTKAIQRLANGDSGARIGDTGRRDELGVLTMAFDSMADQLIEKERRVEEENNVRRRAEEALKDSERQKRQHLSQLEQVLRTNTVSVMAAALSHQLNQRLGSIMNYGRGTLRRLDSNTSSPSHLKHTFEQICNEAERAATILRNIRDYIRGVETEESLEDINQIVTKAAKLLEPQLNERRVKLDLDLNAQPLPSSVIPIEIEQAIINLAQNGIEAIEDDAVVDRKLSVRTFLDDQDIVHVSFTDTGRGVSLDMRDDLFEPFSSTKPLGLGMGLAISRIIIEKHGGSISLEESEPVGTTIQFTLPSAESAVVHAE